MQVGAPLLKCGGLLPYRAIQWRPLEQELEMRRAVAVRLARDSSTASQGSCASIMR
jgi:hypothetical protein